MPTTARLVAAILMAALGYFLAELVKPYLPPAQPVGLFAPLSALVGLVIGWVHTGKHLQMAITNRSDHVPAAGLGIIGVVLVILTVTLLFSLYEMNHRSTRLHYDGPTEAVLDAIDIGIGYLKLAAQMDVIIAALVGGVAVGMITAWVARQFR
jgi:hypothetical protein